MPQAAARLFLPLLLSLALMPRPATAGGWHLRVAQVRTAELTMQELRIDPVAGPADQPAAWRVGAASLSLPRAGWSADGLDGTLASAPGGPGVAGPLSFVLGRERVRGSATLASDAEGLTAEFKRGATVLRWRSSSQPRLGSSLVLVALPVQWLQEPLRRQRADIEVRGGTLDASLQEDTAGGRWRGAWSCTALAVDTPDGALATDGLTMAGTLDWKPGTAWEAKLEARLLRGEWLAEPLYVRHDGEAVRWTLAAQGGADGAWRLSHFSWQDPGALALEGSLDLDPAGAVRRLHIARSNWQFPAAHARYLASPLGPLGFGAIDTKGEVEFSLEHRAGQPLQASIQSAGLDLRDRAGRFAIDALQLALAVNTTDQRTSTLAWQSAQLFRVPLGGARAQASLAPGRWALAAPVVVDLLGGRITLEALTREEDPDQAPRWQARLDARGIQLEQLTRTLGWPLFPGTLSARIPSVRMVGESMQLDGDLLTEVFGGRVLASALALERPFGVAPALSGDLALEQLDLAQLTSAFSFGQIAGRLNGRISGLRLLDWRPVAFDARLRTDEQAPGERRLSQRAVSGLSRIGGSRGAESGLMRVFSSFGYEALALSCRLERNVCHMGGLDEGGSGYTIVRGRGVPYLTVIGHQREVDWPVLVARLKAATTGTAPVVQ